MTKIVAYRTFAKAPKIVRFNLEYSILLRIIVLNIKERKCQSIATIYVYIMINFIWLHVSTGYESFSGHFNLLL
jgi:hypothetical protein